MHVLLVDDDEATRFAVKRTLARMEGIQVSEARDGREALRMLAAAPVDLVLSDFWMPGGPNGVEVLCAALETQPHARRVLMSGTIDEARLRAESEPACVDHIFEKPFTREDWTRALRVAFQFHGAEGAGAPAAAGAEP